ncbi:hypothetical protein E8D34_17950 [Nocardioides sp. GY 10113]|uniref:hypothetical protein n=1 Tax=Nocardioides sp. GY 10113 TaxID=2569761 RepID=UPI0010A85BF8|nr:hypothetical protein [Nocardioides sp. GY 10113]TIC81279.1 hypothetical protein E8D34_17950 [Nocardioides sp. GY 10113]
MENFTMTPAMDRHFVVPAVGCATAASALRTDVQGVVARDAFRAAEQRALVAASAIKRDRAASTGNGWTGIAGFASGSPTWSPPL